MSGSCCARLQRANVEFAAVERPREQSCQNPSKSLAPWHVRLHMRPVLHTQKHGWRLRCAASLLRFARQPCFCVCSTWPHVQTGRGCALACCKALAIDESCISFSIIPIETREICSRTRLITFSQPTERLCVALRDVKRNLQPLSSSSSLTATRRRSASTQPRE